MSSIEKIMSFVNRTFREAGEVQWEHLGKFAAMFAGKMTPPHMKTSLGETADEYEGKIKKKALDLFDLHKIDLSNEYEDPETIGDRTK